MVSLILPRVPGLGIGGGVIAIAYVAILAAIAIPAYQDYIGRTVLSVAMSDSAPYREAVGEFGVRNQRWPDSIDQTGLRPFPGDLNVSSITLGANGVLTVDFVKPPLH